MKAICVDLGGTRAKAGIIENGKIVEYSVVPSNSHTEFEEVIRNLEKLIDQLILKSGKSDYSGIGIAIPGLVDVNANTLISVNQKFSGAVGYDFATWCEKKWGLPLLLENDARAALYGEWQFGSGQTYNNICLMTFGTGIGSASVIDQKMLYGGHFQAGVLGGHFTVDYNGDLCNCGNKGCVEALASSWKLKELATDYYRDLKDSEGAAELDFKILFGHYRQGDQRARTMTEEYIRIWSAGIVNMIHAYDPELFILHGGIMHSSDIILPIMKEYINKHAWISWGDLKITTSSSVDKMALLGMYYKLSKNT